MNLLKASKNIMLLSILCFLVSNAKGQTAFVKDSLSVSAVVQFQQKMRHTTYEVTFEKVISDSRCPKQVNCVRAGEAKVLLSIYDNGEFVTEKEISIHASGYVMEETNLAFTVEDFKIYGMTLQPYPVFANDILESDYELEIVFQKR